MKSEMGSTVVLTVMPGSAASNRSIMSSQAGPKEFGSEFHWLGPAIVIVTWPPSASPAAEHPDAPATTTAAHAAVMTRRDFVTRVLIVAVLLLDFGSNR